MIYMLLADGFEEVEALAPLDLLKRAGAEIYTVAIGTDTPTGSHGVRVFCDLNEKDADPSAPDMLILPGGMPGTKNLDASDFVDKSVKSVNEKGGRIAAICAAPLVLGRRGLLREKAAICYPGFEEELEGASIVPDADVITDGGITTAKGAGVAFDFGLALVRLLFGDEKADELKAATMHPDAAATVFHLNRSGEKHYEASANYISPSLASLAKGIEENSTAVLEEIEEDGEECSYTSDEKFLLAAEIIIENSKASTSLLQRKLSIGYAKAAAYIDAFEALGVISEANGAAPREVLMTKDEWEKLKNSFN